jgi:hypothetical protein
MKGVIMAQENEHIKQLLAARDSEVAHRREVANGLAEKHQRGQDRAIADEKLISSSISRGV